MNQIYKRGNFVVIPVQENFIIINKEKIFKSGHTHVAKIDLARLLIDLAINKKLPKNSYFAESLIRISDDEEYISRLKIYKENDCNFEKLMNHDSYKRHKGAMRQVRYE